MVVRCRIFKLNIAYIIHTIHTLNYCMESVKNFAVCCLVNSPIPLMFLLYS